MLPYFSTRRWGKKKLHGNWHPHTDDSNRHGNPNGTLQKLQIHSQGHFGAEAELGGKMKIKIKKGKKINKRR